MERKLGMRTRVFLVLVALAVGGAGAATYLALDTRGDAVSESDVRELQERLEAQIGGGASPELTQLEAEVEALKSQLEELNGGKGAKAKGGSGGASAGGASTDDPSAGKLRELIEKAKEENEKAENAK